MSACRIGNSLETEGQLNKVRNRFLPEKSWFDPRLATEQSEQTVRSPHIRKDCQLPGLGKEPGKCQAAEDVQVGQYFLASRGRKPPVGNVHLGRGEPGA